MKNSDKRHRFFILWICFLGLALRLFAIHFGLPHLYHADEPIVVNHALAYGTGDFNPHFFKIPPLVSYLLFFCCGLYYLGGRAVGIFQSLQDFEFLFYSDPTSFYLIGRVVFGALLGTLSIWALYQMIRRHFGQDQARLSALGLAVCFLHVRDSHYVYADIPLVLVIILALDYFLRIENDPGSKALHLKCGALIGLAAALKYNGSFLVFPYLLMVFLSAGPRLTNKIQSMGLAALSAVFLFNLLNPFAFLDFQNFISEIRDQSRSHGYVGFLHHLKYSLAGGLGVPLFVAALLGLGRSLWKGPLKARTLGLFAAAYYLIISFAGQPYDRYVLPLIPILIFLSVYFFLLSSPHALRRGSAYSDSRLKSCGNDEKNYHSNSANRALWAIAAVVFLPTFISSLLWISIMIRPDTRTLAQEWVEANIQEGSSLALDWEFYMPRLNFSEAQLQDKLRRLEKSSDQFSKAQKRKLEFLLSHKEKRAPSYQLYFLSNDPSTKRFLFATPTVAYNLETLKGKGIEYVVLAHIQKNRIDEFRRQIETGAVRIAQFSPYRDPLRMVPYDRQPLTGGPFLWKELLARKRNGLPIEIYQLT